MIEDYFMLAFRNLWERKTRSTLTVLGIFLAIVTIFVLLSLSIGLNETVNEQFEELGSNTFFVEPRGRAGAPGSSGGAVELTLEDVSVLEKVNGVRTVSYYIAGTAKTEFNEQTRYNFGIGIPLEKEKMELVYSVGFPEPVEGRLFKKGDTNVVVVGNRYRAGAYFDKPVRTGDILTVNDKEFEVIGILEAIGSPPDDAMVQMPEEDFKILFDSGDRVDYIIVEVNEGAGIEAVAERAQKKLMNHRDVTEKTIDFNILTPEELLAAFGTILNILTAFLVGIGAISVLVGGIGIANTMYTSVLERKKEIGTMKAVGAQNKDILLIFVIEAGVLGLVGGIVGLSVGIIITKIIEYIAQVLLGGDLLRASLHPTIIVGSLIFAFFVGLISGLVPSVQASRLKPADALRYE